MKKITTITLILISVAFFIGCSLTKNSENSTVQKEKNTMENEARQSNKAEKMTKVLIQTTMGDITLALYNETPLHRDNFIKLVNEHYYDGVLFHRIIQHFMIQCGDPDSKTAKQGQALGNGGPGYTIPAEFVSTLYHKRGAVAAARLGDNVNPKKESSGSQFYIVDGQTFPKEQLEMLEMKTGKQLSQEQINCYTTLGGAPHLDGSYTVFGEIISGMDIVDKIAAQPKDQRDRPLTDIKIVTMKIVE
jgi:cyclophilin family peptidyl-prolyl cis-trans isomerase